jgi:hypothetical protein
MAAAPVYTWKIERLDCYPAFEMYENVVTTVYWRLFAKGGGCEATSYGSVSLKIGTLSEGFTPFSDLTEVQVVGWVKAAIDGPKHEAILAQNIADQLSPPIVSPPLPWAASEN